MACLLWSDVNVLDSDLSCAFIRTLTLLHVLKHLRRSNQYGIVSTFLGTISAFDVGKNPNATIGSDKELTRKLLTALVCPPSTAANPNVVTVNLTGQLNKLQTADLLERKPLTTLPGQVLAGPWSRPVPNFNARKQFYQTGLMLDGVWLASNGKVSATEGDQHDVIGYDWPMKAMDSAARDKFLAAVPATYDVDAYPSDLLASYFPNIITTPYGPNPLAFKCIMDAVLCSALCTHLIPALRSEKPFVVCMPDEPTKSESTNQGKSYCAYLMARAIAPGIEVISTSASDDAPGRRAIAAEIAAHGTLCMKEWAPPRNDNHVFSNKNMQTLCDGDGISYGKVLGNGAEKIRLTYPIFADAKACNVTDDMVNRTIFIWMRKLTNDERNRQHVVRELQSGLASMLVRFAALSTIDRHDLTSVQFGSTTITGIRFPVIRAMAHALWLGRGGDPSEANQLEQAMELVAAHHLEHTSQADSSGVLAQMESNTIFSLRFTTLVEEMTFQEMESMAVMSNQDMSGQGANMKQLVQARARSTGYEGREVGMIAMLTGGNGRPALKHIWMALAEDIRKSLKIGETKPLPGHLGIAGWRIHRRKDVNDSPRVEILPPDSNNAARAKKQGTL
jgi:hypothetical protein